MMRRPWALPDRTRTVWQTEPSAAAPAQSLERHHVAEIAMEGSGQFPQRSTVGLSVRARMLRVLLPIILCVDLSMHLLVGPVFEPLTGNGTLALALMCLLSAMALGVVIFGFVRVVGKSIDRAELERLRAEEQIVRLNAELEQRVHEATDHSVQLEAVNKELEAFSYSVSHDLRAPLRAIDGFSQALLEDCGSTLDDQGRHYLQRVRAATERMSQLIDDLLSLARVTRSAMQWESVDLSQLAQTIAAELEKTQPGRRAKVVIAPQLLARGDARLLRIALENLLGNAWKYTSKCPQALIEFGVTASGGQPAYFVRDNGVGFDMAYAGKLFGAFQRLHTEAEFPGTGIGLATVQRIIHRHHGRTWADGAVGQGATFYFTL
jgi:light-regulated signal transduction histidine kinase (bacteriophytochrome)